MRKVFFVLLILCCALKSSAQYNLPVYELTSDTAAAYLIESSYTQLLEDPKNQWDIKQVSQPPLSSRFHVNETKQKGINYRVHTYWVRFTIRNNLDHAATIYFNNEFGDYGVPFENIYLYAQGDNNT